MEENDSDLRILICPRCGKADNIARVDRLIGYAGIAGVTADGSIEWDGYTELDWESQRPDSNPAEFICQHCGERFPGDELGL